MMIIKPGEIWIADIPFTNAGGRKKRPVLVLWLAEPDLVVASVTSAPPRSPTDVVLKDFKGLADCWLASCFDGALVASGLS